MNIIKNIERRLKSLRRTKQERRHAMVGPAKLWKMKRDFQIQFLQEMGLTPNHYLLDIGCGTLRGGIPLIEYLQDGHYFGIESREEALDEGRRELQEAKLGKTTTLILSTDISQLKINQYFDYIWAFSVLIHMDDNVVEDTLDFVSRHLRYNGAFYANVNIGEENKGNWQGFPLVWRTLEFYRNLCSKHALTLTDLGALRDYGHISKKESQDNQKMLKITKD